jgi:hypothetical protein
MWAQDKYNVRSIKEASREAYAEKYIHASSLVWLEPYKRPMKITIISPDYLNTETELDILAADDVESIAQAAMQADVDRSAAEKQARLDLRHVHNGAYQPNRITVMIDVKTKKKYWWNIIIWHAFNLTGESEGRCIPSEEGEEGREWSGQV